MGNLQRNSAASGAAWLGLAFCLAVGSLLPARAEDASASATAFTRTPFQLYLNSKPCSGTICRIDFPAVPPKSRLEIRDTSCFIKGTGNRVGDIAFPFSVIALQLLVVGSTGAIATAVTLVPRQTGTYGDLQVIFSSNDTVANFATAGQHFQSYLQIPSPYYRFDQFACSIGGDMVQ